MDTTQLDELLAACGDLDADIRYCPANGYFTVLARGDWNSKDQVNEAIALQQKLKQLSEPYANIVCYCFDPFSTLVYVV